MTFPYDSEGRYLDSDRDAGGDATKEPMLQRGDTMDELQQRDEAGCAGGSRNAREYPARDVQQVWEDVPTTNHLEDWWNKKMFKAVLVLWFENACMWPGDEEVLELEEGLSK